ncbi:MAG: response regulator [Elusimicrobiales bacterium]|nr:response regulator [Elusimicrobiales bacterium]
MAENEKEKPSLLLVEDNEDDVLIARRAFGEFRIFSEVHVARDGQEALDMLTGAGGKKALRPSIILLDITLPLMDGIAVLKRLKSDRQLCSIPVVMLTTSSRQEDVQRSYAAGAASYVTKPPSLEEYADLARKFEMYWITVSRLPF